ncbi:glycosyltransferase [candidate division WWE3 bacterium]|nr:glycosyltransferase [candidate division WWE3 bacterium]
MNIAFVSSASANSSGGDGRVARELAEVLSKTPSENNILLILSGEETGKTKTTKTFTQFEISGRKKQDVILPLLDPVKINSLLKVLRDFSPDIIHFHDQGPAAFVSLLWALKNKTPTVFTSHTIPSEVVTFGLAELFPKMQSLFDSKVFDSYFDLFLKKSSAIIAINDSVLKDLETYDLETPVYTIPNGRNLENYADLSCADITATPKKLIFVGYLNKRKNQAYLIDAMKHLPKKEFELNLIGVPLNDGYDELLKNKVEKAEVLVSFVGKVPHKKIPKMLEESHFFVSASLKEVQSLSVLEALASGTPIVSLENETTNEFVDVSVGYNFPLETAPKDFAAKLKELASLPQEDYQALCLAAKEKVSHMDWSNVASQTLEMYEEVVSEAGEHSKGLNGLKNLLKSVDMRLFE